MDAIKIEVRSFEELHAAGKRTDLRAPYRDITLTVPKSSKTPRGWRDKVESKKDIERVGGAADKLLTIHGHSNEGNTQGSADHADIERARALTRAFARNDTVTIVVRLR
jgi:hypothetical protein